MDAMAICISTCLLLLSTGATETNQPPYNPTESFLLNCASSSNQTYYEQGRVWESDANSRHISNSQNIQSLSSESTASEQDYSVPKVPYKTARIFRSKFTYSFYPLSPGPKFVRLYFYSATYSGLNRSDSFFSVTANNFVLLRNFSAFLFVSAQNPPLPYFVKEFIIKVDANYNQNPFNITFTPSPNSYAFINGIEIISTPDNFYTAPMDKPITFVNNKATPFFFTDDTALENLYRLNVGGMDVFNINDTGMFRTWIQDLTYIYGYKAGTVPYRPNTTIQYNSNTPAYTAPEIVYSTFRQMDPKGLNNTKYNLSWLFPVDSGFSYLVRLHFCETLREITLENQRVFFIYINSMIAEPQMDVIHFSGGSKIPMYRDYIVFVEKDKSHDQQGYLLLELHPNVGSKPKYYNAILNGLEIFKLNQSHGNLAGPNPNLQEHSVSTIPQPKTRQKHDKKKFIIAIVFPVSVLGLFFLSLLIIFNKRIITSSKKKKEDSSLPSELCRHFTINNIKAATCGFDEKLVIGVGGFGNVYRGRIAVSGAGQVDVAVKRLNPRSKQGAKEFRTEIEMLSKLRDVHLVSLVGYCDDNNEMILVYEYMPRGTLRDHLYGGAIENPTLPWKRRLKICIEAARGLHYLHAGANHVIIHRDVKSTNILLDEKWVAKLSDFGLSRVGPTSALETHVSTDVKGSFGYLDPEYCRRHQLTEKSDVYSFGVVLWEVLCARPVMGRALPKEQVGLASWAQNCYRNGSIEQIVDPNLKGQIAAVCLKKFAEIAVRCVEDDGVGRPSMADVVGGLEFAMELQESDEKLVDGGAEVFGSRESKAEEFFSTDSGKEKSSEENGSEPTSVFSSGERNGMSVVGRVISDSELFLSESL